MESFACFGGLPVGSALRLNLDVPANRFDARPLASDDLLFGGLLGHRRFGPGRGLCRRASGGWRIGWTGGFVCGGGLNGLLPMDGSAMPAMVNRSCRSGTHGVRS